MNGGHDAVPAWCETWLTFTVIEGGSTGVGQAGTLAAIARDLLRGAVRHIDLTPSTYASSTPGPDLSTRAQRKGFVRPRPVFFSRPCWYVEGSVCSTHQKRKVGELMGNLQMKLVMSEQVKSELDRLGEGNASQTLSKALALYLGVKKRTQDGKTALGFFNRESGKVEDEIIGL